MTAAAESWPGAEAPGATEPQAGSARRTITSIPDIVAELAGDVLELLALESRAAALTLALLVFVCVAAACFALFAWLGVSTIGVVLLVRAGLELPLALAVLVTLNAALAIAAGFLVRRLIASILFRGAREQRDQTALERG